MFRECPHCFKRVGITQTGICPSCRKNVRDTASIDPNRSPVFIEPASAMPDRCINCGEITPRRVKVADFQSVEYQSTPEYVTETLLAFLGVLLFILSVPFVYFFGFSRKSPREMFRKLEVKVPQCERCADNRIDPVSVNHEKGILKLAAHLDFVEAFNKLNSSDSEQS